MDEIYARMTLSEYETAAVNNLLAERDGLLHANAEMGQKVEFWQDAYDVMKRDHDSLRSEVAELREALRPFAELGTELGDGIVQSIIWKDDEPIKGASAYRDGKDYNITLGDLRRAAAVLAKHKGYVAASPPDTHDEG